MNVEVFWQLSVVYLNTIWLLNTQYAFHSNLDLTFIIQWNGLSTT